MWKLFCGEAASTLSVMLQTNRRAHGKINCSEVLCAEETHTYPGAESMSYFNFESDLFGQYEAEPERD